jgi:outer membrane biogenesis lipoprotein LolB
LKKIIAITFILLIGLMLLEGCSSTTVQPTANQQQNEENINSESQQDQQQVGSKEIPKPPALPE